MKKIGQLIELDPNKQYILMIDSSCMERDHVAQASRMLQEKRSFTLAGIGLPKKVVLIEHKGRIVNIKQYEKDNSKR